MTAVQWRFKALDTYFFREAVPFHAGEGGQGGQSSVFPPLMSTLQGAIRYQLALSRGWRPGADRLPIKLGDSDNLGDLRLCGPYLSCGDDLLWPAPLFLMRLQATEERKASYYRLSPGDPVSCDLGQVRLPVMPAGARGSKPMDKYWLSVATMEKVLAGGVPEDDDYTAMVDNPAGFIPVNGVAYSDQLWKNEPKVGIGREADTRTALDKNLYAINLIRTKKKVAVAVGVEGVPIEWSRRVKQENNIVNLGGESRLAELSVVENPIKLPARPELTAVNGRILFTVTLITPGYFGNQAQTQKALKDLKPWINYTCITACVGRAKQIGGWDLKANRPRPLRSYIPAGSSWFFEASASDAKEIAELHGRYIGEKSSNAYGYGQILIGRWEEKR